MKDTYFTAVIYCDKYRKTVYKSSNRDSTNTRI